MNKIPKTEIIIKLTCVGAMYKQDVKIKGDEEYKIKLFATALMKCEKLSTLVKKGTYLLTQFPMEVEETNTQITITLKHWGAGEVTHKVDIKGAKKGVGTLMAMSINESAELRGLVIRSIDLIDRSLKYMNGELEI